MGFRKPSLPRRAASCLILGQGLGGSGSQLCLCGLLRSSGLAVLPSKSPCLFVQPGGGARSPGALAPPSCPCGLDQRPFQSWRQDRLGGRPPVQTLPGNQARRAVLSFWVRRQLATAGGTGRPVPCYPHSTLLERLGPLAHGPELPGWPRAWVTLKPCSVPPAPVCLFSVCESAQGAPRIERGADAPLPLCSAVYSGACHPTVGPRPR